MNDPFESSLRARLQNLGVAHDEVRADTMIAAATAGDPLPERRHVLAPLAAAAAVVAVGATVAVVAQHGDDPAPSANPVGAPTTSARPDRSENLDVTVTYYATAAPNGPTAFHTYGVVYDSSRPNPLPAAAFRTALEDLTVDRITVVNSRDDRAAIRLVSGKKVVLSADVSGTARTDVTFPSTRAAGLEPVVQCREPGRGPSCGLTVTLHGHAGRWFRHYVLPLLSPTATPSTAPGPTMSDGTAEHTTPPAHSSSRVYVPPAPPSCADCQIP